MKITEKTILRDYNKLKALARIALKREEYSAANIFIHKAATLMYESNLFYTDDELEYLMILLGTQLFKSANSTVKSVIDKRLVFYDYFVMDNRGLTEQYIEALHDSDYSVLYIGCRKKNAASYEIYEKLESYKNFTVLQTELDIDHIQLVYDEIVKFCPQIIVAHTAPFDIYGLTLIHQFSECTKYLINITDHAFWLGYTVFDYYFEFRDYGYNLSSKYRGIDTHKLLKLPFYPIINENIPFAGFDFSVERKKLIVSGGSTYKIEGSPVFFELVKHILDTHPETIFLYLGNGDFTHIHDFILKNYYQSRFFVFPERKDIYQVLCHSYLYLNTYPLTGSLMTQLACLGGVAPITLRKCTSDHEGDIDELFLHAPEFPIVFTDKNKLLEYVDTYLYDTNVYRDYCKILKHLIISKSAFKSLLLSYLENPVNQLTLKSYDIEVDNFSKDCIAQFNTNFHIKYYRIFISKNKFVLIHFLLYIFLYLMTKGFLLFKKILQSSIMSCGKIRILKDRFNH